MTRPERKQIKKRSDLGNTEKSRVKGGEKKAQKCLGILVTHPLAWQTPVGSILKKAS